MAAHISKLTATKQRQLKKHSAVNQVNGDRILARVT